MLSAFDIVYPNMVQNFFRSPTSTTSATDQARPVTGSLTASTTSNDTTIQPLTAAVVSSSDDNPLALTSESNG
jgi:hypothetical protein